VNNCRKRNICPRVSACVLACFRVHNRSPDGQELSSVTPSSRVRSHRRRRMTNSTASETSAALRRPGAYILVLCLPFDWGPGMVTFSHSRARWSSRWAEMPMHVLSHCCTHALAAHIRANMLPLVSRLRRTCVLCYAFMRTHFACECSPNIVTVNPILYIS
jgi:hypothetical protein